MKPLIALIRVGWKTHSPLATLRSHMRENHFSRYLFPLAVLFSMAILTTIGYYILQVTGQLDSILRPAGLQRVIPALAVLAAQLTALIFSMYHMVSSFYFSRDLEWLIPLPLTPRQVMLGKFSIIVLNHYVFLIPLISPFLIQYGILGGQGPTYWLRLVVVLLLLPLVPLAISSLVVILLMRVVNLSRHKEILVVLGVMLLMLTALVPQFLIRDGGGEGSLTSEQVIALFSSSDSLTHRFTAAFPPARWAVNCLDPVSGGSAAMNGLLLAGFSLGAFILLLLAAEKLFYHGLIGLDETAAKRGGSHVTPLAFSSGHRPVTAIFKREMRIMNRTAMFLLNGVYSTAFIPLILLVMITTGHQDNARLLGLFTSANPAVAVLSIALVCILSGLMNGTASSAFSREGHSFWVSQVIPVAWKKQLLGKFLHGMAVAVLGITIAAIMMVVALHLPLWMGITGALMALTAAVGFTCIGLLIDLSRPLLNWVSPQRAIKQNLNVFFAMVLNLGTLLLLWILTARLIRLGMKPMIIVTIMETALLILAGLSAAVLLGLAPRLFHRLAK